MSIFSLFNAKPEDSGTNSELRSDYNPAFLTTLTQAIMQANAVSKGETPINEKTSLTIAAVYSAVKLLSEIPASLSILHQQKDGNYYKTIDDSVIARTLRKPSAAQTSFNWMQTMLMRLHMRGNAYAFIDKRELQAQIIPIYDQDVEVLVAPTGDEVFYRIGGQTFASYEIIHFRGMSLDGFVGISPIQWAARTLRNMIDSSRFMSKLFESGIMASGFFTTADRLGKSSYDRLKADIEQNSGINRAGKAKILDSGLKFERNTLSAVDGQIIEWMGFGVEEVARIYRVPKHLLYLDAKGGSTRSFSTQAREFLTYSLAPILNNVEEELAVKLFTTIQYDSGKERIKFDIKALLRVDPKERADYYAQLFNLGSITPNEIRSEEDLAPIEGGDSTYIQLNLVPLDKIEKIVDDRIMQQQVKTVN